MEGLGIILIIAAGFAGGYIVRWVQEKRNQDNSADFKVGGGNQSEEKAPDRK